MSYFGNLYDSNFEKNVDINQFRGLKTYEVIRLAGSNLAGASGSLDVGTWITGGTNNGAPYLSGGQVTFQTNTTANGSASLRSAKIARFVGASGNFFRGAMRFGDTGTTNNWRKFGAYDIDNGFYFFLSGTTFGVGSRKGTIDTHVNSGSFNGLYGNSYSIDIGVHTYEIHYSNTFTYFLFDNKLLHKLSSSGTTNINTGHLYITAENVNTNGSTTNVIMDARAMTINRAGVENTKPTFYNIATNETRVLKTSPGTLHVINVNSKGSGGGSIAFYDGLSAAGTAICSIDTTTVQGYFEYHLDFNSGLTYVSTSTLGNVTVIWE